MSEKFSPKETIRVIDKEGLLRETMAMKARGMRLSQACASYNDGKYELSYSFSDDDTLDYETLRVNIGLAERVPSIHNFYSCASFYENEMRELFGVKIELIEPDYHDKLYRIKAESPFLPDDAKTEQKKEEEEITLNEADRDMDQVQQAQDEAAADKRPAGKSGAAGKPEAAKPEAAKPEAAKPEAAKPEDTAKSGAAKPEAAAKLQAAKKEGQ